MCELASYLLPLRYSMTRFDGYQERQFSTAGSSREGFGMFRGRTH
jgi:hypothetical protein